MHLTDLPHRLLKVIEYPHLFTTARSLQQGDDGLTDILVGHELGQQGPQVPLPPGAGLLQGFPQRARFQGHPVERQFALDQRRVGLRPPVQQQPDGVQVTGFGRPGRWETPLGDFEFRHVKTEWLHGYERLEVSDGRWAFVATPEKALLDLVYLQPGGDTPAYLAELRLQAFDRLDLDRLARLATENGRPKLRRAAQHVAALARSAAAEYEML
jgi:hypothetical protein